MLDQDRSAAARMLSGLCTTRLLLACAMCFAAFSAPVLAAFTADDITVHGGVTVVAQAANDERTQTEIPASGDLFVQLARPRGEWLMYIEGNTTPDPEGVSAFYPTVNADARSVLTRSGGGRAQISEFNYTAFLAERHTLMLGLIDPSAWLDRGRIANDENRQFLNGSFVNNATIAFPDYTVGGVFRRRGMSGVPEITAVLSSSEGIADLPERSYQSLLNLFARDRGMFAGTGASWLNDRTSWRIGAWLRTEQRTLVLDSDRLGTNYGIYGVFGWQSGNSAVNIRAGLANPDLSIATQFAAFAYQRRFRIGTFGVGAARTYFAQGLREGSLDPALDSEIFFRLPITSKTHITPSIQSVVNPFPGGQAVENRARTTVLGLRLHWSY